MNEKYEYDVIEREWNPKDGSWSKITRAITIQDNKDLRTGKKNRMVVVIQQHNTTKKHHLYFPAWGELRVVLGYLIKLYGKAEVEKELGVKIK